MGKYEVRYRLKGDVSYHKIVLVLPDMEHAVKCGYAHAKGLHGAPVVSFQVRPLNTNI